MCAQFFILCDHEVERSFPFMEIEFKGIFLNISDEIVIHP